MATQPWRIERYTNSGSTTLNGAVSGGATTITVTSAASFPTSGDFRLILSGTEEVTVKSVSGTTFTLTAGTAGSHSNGATVKLALTSDGLDDAFLQAFGFPGSVYPYNRIEFQGVTKVAADFTWLNQGTATCVDADDGGLKMTLPSEANHQVRGKYLSAPGSTPWSVTANVWVGPGFKLNGTYVGLFAREASSSKFYFLPLKLQAAVAMWSMTGVTATPTVIDTAFDLSEPNEIWMRLEDDGTDINGYYSCDGVNFRKLYTDGRTAFFTSGPDQVGFGGSSGSGTAGLHLYIKSWIVE